MFSLNLYSFFIKSFFYDKTEDTLNLNNPSCLKRTSLLLFLSFEIYMRCSIFIGSSGSLYSEKIYFLMENGLMSDL